MLVFQLPRISAKRGTCNARKRTTTMYIQLCLECDHTVALLNGRRWSRDRSVALCVTLQAGIFASETVSELGPQIVQFRCLRYR